MKNTNTNINTNTNTKSSLPFTFVAFSLATGNNEYRKLIASTYFVKSFENFDINKFTSRVYLFNKISNERSFFIFVHVTNDLVESKLSSYGFTNSSIELYVYKVSFKNFFNDCFIIKNLLQYSKYSNRIIYGFENKIWGNIVVNFRFNKIIISGGSNTKRHFLSPVHMRLSQFITCVEGLEQGGVFESFHDFDKDKTSIMLDYSSKKINKIINEYKESKTKEKNKIDNKLNSSDSNNNNNIDSLDSKIENKSINLKNNSNTLISSQGNNKNKNNKSQQIREYHSSLKILENDNNKNNLLIENKDKKSIINIEKSNININYLDLINQLIINTKLSSIQKQMLIESSWIDLFKNQLDNNKYLIDRYSHRLYNILFEANKTLDILYKNNQLFKTFPFISAELNKIEYLMLTFSLVLVYHNRVGYTSLSTIVGNHIIYSVYKLKLKNLKSLDIINKSDYFMSFEEFKISIKFKSTDNIKLGDYFISILSTFPTNLFQREYSLHDSNMDNSNLSDLATVKINSDYLEDIKNNIIIPPITLPMISEPVKWSDNLSGGYISNQEMGLSIITGSKKHAHIITNKDSLYKAVNYMSSIKFSINNLLLEYLKNEGSYLLDIDDGDKLQRDITLKIASTFLNIPFYLTNYAD